MNWSKDSANSAFPILDGKLKRPQDSAKLASNNQRYDSQWEGKSKRLCSLPSRSRCVACLRCQTCNKNKYSICFERGSFFYVTGVRPKLISRDLVSSKTEHSMTCVFIAMWLPLSSSGKTGPSMMMICGSMTFRLNTSSGACIDQEFFVFSVTTKSNERNKTPIKSQLFLPWSPTLLPSPPFPENSSLWIWSNKKPMQKIAAQRSSVPLVQPAGMLKI